MKSIPELSEAAEARKQFRGETQRETLLASALGYELGSPLPSEEQPYKMLNQVKSSSIEKRAWLLMMNSSRFKTKP